MSVDECQGNVEFLLNCGASVSLIKLEALADDVLVHILAKPIGIEGIGKGTIYTSHYVELTLQPNIHDVFLVVKDDFKNDQSGIIGSDFCHEQDAVIDYQDHILKVKSTIFEIQTIVTSLGRVKIPIRIAQTLKKTNESEYSSDESCDSEVATAKSGSSGSDESDHSVADPQGSI